MEKITTLRLLLNRLKYLKTEIVNIQRDCGYRGENDITGIPYPEGDAEELFLWDELSHIMNTLDEATGDISYLCRPVVETGRLVMSPAGRLGFPKSKHELTCGSGVEVLIEDDGFRDSPYWYAGRIEHDGERYYITGNRRVPLEGILARRRG